MSDWAFLENKIKGQIKSKIMLALASMLLLRVQSLFSRRVDMARLTG